jgi:flagellin-like hook-associated protein FlgL
MSGTVNPNVTIALRSLAATKADLQKTVREAATGNAVAIVEDNPAVYVVAQR